MSAFIALLTTIGDVFDALSTFAPKIITFCAIVAAFLPPQPIGFLGNISKVINYVAFNVKYAKNQTVPADNG